MAKNTPTNSYPLSYVSSELNNMLSSILREYSEGLYVKAQKITEEIAHDFADKLKTVTPRSSSEGTHLADTVVVTSSKDRSLGRETHPVWVHYKKWQISHLLEFGWTLRSGKKMTRQPFVRPLFDSQKSRYYKTYKEGLQ